jgi:hypothetical protein
MSSKEVHLTGDKLHEEASQEQGELCQANFAGPDKTFLHMSDEEEAAVRKLEQEAHEEARKEQLEKEQQSQRSTGGT